jgi:hypothetical protein
VLYAYLKFDPLRSRRQLWLSLHGDERRIVHVVESIHCSGVSDRGVGVVGDRRGHIYQPLHLSVKNGDETKTVLGLRAAGTVSNMSVSIAP